MISSGPRTRAAGLEPWRHHQVANVPLAAEGSDRLTRTMGCEESLLSCRGERGRCVVAGDPLCAGNGQSRPKSVPERRDGARADGDAPVVVVTGASAGIGRATAVAFGRRGWRVALLARGRQRLASAAEEVRVAGGQSLAIPADVADAEAVEAAATQVVAHWGRSTFGSTTRWRRSSRRLPV